MEGIILLTIKKGKFVAPFKRTFNTKKKNS